MFCNLSIHLSAADFFQKVSSWVFEKKQLLGYLGYFSAPFVNFCGNFTFDRC